MLRRWLMRRRYRRAAWGTFGWILFDLSAAQLRGMSRAFPRIWNVIDEAYVRGESADVIGAELAAITFAHVILSQSTPDERAAMRNELAANEPYGTAHWMVSTVRIAIGNMEAMASAGRLEHGRFLRYSDELLGAIRGEDSNERSRKRIMNDLATAMGIAP